MKVHRIKIYKEFADAKVDDCKPFELRRNDRNFQVGDIVCYTVVDKTGNKIKHLLNGRTFMITYVLSGFTGLQNSHCIFAEKSVVLPDMSWKASWRKNETEEQGEA